MKKNLPENRFYVYLLIDPRKNVPTPFYVGKGQGNRAESHFVNTRRKYSRNKLKERVIDKIRSLGLSPEVYIVLDSLTESEALGFEKVLILRYGRRNTKTGILTNLTDGGEGMSGYVYSEEQKSKMRQRMTGAGSPTYGVGHTKEARNKMSVSQQARAKRGEKTRHSEEWKQKLRGDNAGGKATRKCVVKLLSDSTVIENFESMTAAAKAVGMTKNNFAQWAVKDGSLPKDGFFYRYEDSPDITADGIKNADALMDRRNRADRNALSGKAVKKLVGKTETVYESVKEAARAHPEVKYATLWQWAKKGKRVGDSEWSFLT